MGKDDPLFLRRERPELIRQARQASTGAIVVPPVTSLVYHAYSILEHELASIRARQVGGEPIDCRQIKALVDALSNAHRVETEAAKKERLGALSDEELKELLKEAQEVLG